MTQEPRKGVFIAIEGGDGAGKTDQIRLLQERWESLFTGWNVVFTKEPGGGSVFSHDIRQLALNHEDAGSAEPGTLFGLMTASRFEHLGKLITPHLAKGDVVICDRFEASTYAYQVKGMGADYLRGSYLEHRASVRALLGEHAYRTIVLDVDPDVAMGRLAARKLRQGDQNHFDLRPRVFHETVREALKEYCSTINPTAIRIDGNPGPEEVHSLLEEQIRLILANK
ncbi:MAG: dTMP kinase [Patescibacteria group bacterium]